MKKRGQVSVEYMAIIGITTIIVLSILAVSNYHSRQVEDTIHVNQIDRIGKEIIDKSESMYYFGEPSRTTLKVFIPEGIHNITIDQNGLTFNVTTRAGLTEMFYPSAVPLDGNLSYSPGIRNIIIEAKGGKVCINGT